MPTAVDKIFQSQSAIEHAELLHVIEATLNIQTPQQFLQWSRGILQKFLPHESMVCGVGQIHSQGIEIKKLLYDNFPPQYMIEIRRPDGSFLSPIMAHWCLEQKPQLFDPTLGHAIYAKLCGATDYSTWLAIFDKYQLHNVAAHGMRDIDSAVTSYFSFSRIPETLRSRHAHLLELLVPHMHVALKRVLIQVKSFRYLVTSQKPRITDREQEILHWLRQGKTNGEIAHILSLSEHTVKNQVRSILVKLRVNNRTQAVAKVMDKP